MSGPSRRDIRRMLERLENKDGDDVPDIIIKDTVVETRGLILTRTVRRFRRIR